MEASILYDAPYTDALCQAWILIFTHQLITANVEASKVLGYRGENLKWKSQRVLLHAKHCPYLYEEKVLPKATKMLTAGHRQWHILHNKTHHSAEQHTGKLWEVNSANQNKKSTEKGKVVIS